MYQDRKILALVPARGGSKGLPGKNTIPFLGKPLLAWTVDQARQSRYLDRIVVSTDDPGIAAVSASCGADVPFTRPAELATDQAEGIDVVLHAVGWFEERGEPYDLLMLLQPTSPLRSVGDIDRSVELLFERRCGAIVSVCEVDHHPFWMNTLPSDGCMKDFLKPEFVNANRQELPKYFRINGAVYLAESAYLKRMRGFFGDSTYAYVMPRDRSVDIDTRLDLVLAEAIKSSL